MSLRFILTSEDFAQLVKGKEVSVKSTTLVNMKTSCTFIEAKIILSDIGFGSMLDKIYEAENEAS